MQANALSTQVEAIASALSPSPGPQERQMALRTLVELRRLEQLRAIAESKNNSTYFFGDRCQFNGPFCTFRQ